MQQRTLGKSGLRVSLIGLGTNNFGGRTDLEGARKVVHAALDNGITLFDTADVYGNKGGSETILGEIFGARRQEIVLATKFGSPMDADGKHRNTSRRYIINAVEASLKRLRTDWIDLYQLHRHDGITPLEETLRALDDLISSGKVRYIGASNLPSWQVVEAQWIARELGTHRFISSQDEYSLLQRNAERELIPALHAHSVGLIPYLPLAGGLLSGKYKRGAPLPAGTRLADGSPRSARILTEPRLELATRLEAFAQSRGHTLLDLAFSWLAAQSPVASIIAGATRAEQIEQNVKAADWVLSASELAEIDAITKTEITQTGPSNVTQTTAREHATTLA